MKRLIPLILLAGLIQAQPRAARPLPGRATGASGAQNPAALKEALGLTGQQVQQLFDLRKQHAQDTRQLREQVREKRQAVARLMQPQNPDSAEVGQAMVEVKRLQDTLKGKRADLQARARAILTPEQQARLQQFEQAAQMGPAVRQAAALGLLAAPQGAAAPGAGPLWRGPAAMRGRLGRPRI